MFYRVHIQLIMHILSQSTGIKLASQTAAAASTETPSNPPQDNNRVAGIRTTMSAAAAVQR
jgi:hypothetical protein